MSAIHVVRSADFVTGPTTWSPASKLGIDAPGRLIVKKIEAVEGIT